MMGQWTVGLLVYGVIMTGVTVILASLYAHCGSSVISETKEVKGNVNTVTKTEVGLITIDNSKDTFSDEASECNCGILALNWTLLELMVLGLIGISLIGGLIKGTRHLMERFHKRRAKAQEETRKNDLEMRERIRSEIATTMSRDTNQTEQPAGTMEPTLAAEMPRIDYP
jgi:hypothetical protein